MGGVDFVSLKVDFGFRVLFMEEESCLVMGKGLPKTNCFVTPIDLSPRSYYKQLVMMQDRKILFNLVDGEYSFTSVSRSGWGFCADPTIPPPPPQTMYDHIPWGLSETLSKIQRAIGDAEVVTLIHDSTPKWGREFLGVMVF